MSKSFFVLILLVFCISQNTKAQNQWCGNHSHTVLNEPSSLVLDSFETYYQNQLLQYNSNTFKRANKYIIPVVFHIIHQGGQENISNEAIKGLLNQVNEDFALQNSDTTLIQAPFKKVAADCGIEFKLAQIDDDGNCSNGITRTFSWKTENVRDYAPGNNVKKLIGWNRTKYLNIWVVKSIYSTSEGTTLGYAYYPGQGGSNDGIIMRSDQMNSNTLTHEIGHYLNLKHTFDNGCFGGDDVSDTPPTAEANFGCPRGRNSCSNETIDQIDQIENYMDYSDCTAMFTAGQKVRMHSAIDFYRSYLVSEKNLKETGISGDVVITKPIADFALEKEIMCSGNLNTLTFNGCDNSGNTTFNWKITGPQEFSSSDANPKFQLDSQGVYDIELSVTNSKGKSTKVSKGVLRVISDDLIINSPYSNSLNSIPTNYQFKSTDPKFKWELSDRGRDNSKCLFLDNFSKSQPSFRASFVLPAINIIDFEDQTFRYDLAYAGINDESNDQLNIYVSLDCGESWRLISSETSKRLATTINRAYAYVPTDDNNWEEKTIDLSRYKKYNLLLKFEFISKNGNNLFIDNIRLGTTQLGIVQEPYTHQFQIFPNPAHSESTLVLKQSNTTENGILKIKDISGRTLQCQVIDREENLIDTKGLNAGVYLFILETQYGITSKRIIIQ